MTRQNYTVTSRERETRGTLAAKFVIEIRKDLRHHGDHNDTGKFPFGGSTTAADGEERHFSYTGLQYLTDKCAGVPLHLRQEVVTVGHAGGAWDRKDCRRNKRVPVLIDDQNAVNSIECLFKLAELEMNRLRGGLDLIVAEISNDGIHTSECQVNRLKNFGGLFGEDIQGRRKLFVGAGKGILVIEPACIRKKRHRKED